MSFSTVIVLERLALIDVIRWDINVYHVAAVHGDDAHFYNNLDSKCWLLNLRIYILFPIHNTSQTMGYAFKSNAVDLSKTGYGMVADTNVYEVNVRL